MPRRDGSEEPGASGSEPRAPGGLGLLPFAELSVINVNKRALLDFTRRAEERESRGEQAGRWAGLPRRPSNCVGRDGKSPISLV